MLFRFILLYGEWKPRVNFSGGSVGKIVEWKTKRPIRRDRKSKKWMKVKMKAALRSRLKRSNVVANLVPRAFLRLLLGEEKPSNELINKNASTFSYGAEIRTTFC